MLWRKSEVTVFVCWPDRFRQPKLEAVLVPSSNDGHACFGAQGRVCIGLREAQTNFGHPVEIRDQVSRLAAAR